MHLYIFNILLLNHYVKSVLCAALAIDMGLHYSIKKKNTTHEKQQQAAAVYRPICYICIFKTIY